MPHHAAEPPFNDARQDREGVVVGRPAQWTGPEIRAAA